MRTYRSLVDIAADIRHELKSALPSWKFSVRVKDGLSITVTLVSGPVSVGVEYAQLNPYSPTLGHGLTPAGLRVMRKALEILSREHWDDSDAQVDYFCCNYYRHLHVGSWDKPYQVKGKV